MAAHDIKSDIVVHVSYPSRAADEENSIHLSDFIADSPPTAINEVETLPRQDGGRGAWLFLAGACIIEGITWGFPYSYGVFRSYFFTHAPFEGVASVSVAGVMSNGVLQVSLPFVLYFLNYYPMRRKTTMWLGCLICAVSPIGGAYSKTPAQLIVCLGPLYGLGAGMLFAPTINYMSEWFVKRKSLAYGVICAMGGLCGAVLPPLFTVCLDKFGYEPTLIGWALVVLVLTSMGLLCIHPRTPHPVAPKPTLSDFGFVRKPLFWVLLTATIIQGLAHYVPSIYIPSYALDVGLTSTKGALLLSLLNLATAIGQPLQGMLADWRSSYDTAMLLSTVGSGIEALLIWGFSRSLWSLAIFVLLYGSTAGGFAVLRPRFATAIVGHDKDKEQSLLIFGVLTAARGFSIVASGFIASAQINESLKVTSGYGAGKWLRVILYTGIVMLVASLGSVGMFFKAPIKTETDSNCGEKEHGVAESS